MEVRNDTSDFKETVNAYIELHDEIARSSKHLRELRKKKDALGDLVLQFMRSNRIDECELPDGKLVRKVSKRTSTLKKEMVFSELQRITGNEERAVESLQNIFNMRQIVEKEILTRTVKKIL